MNNAKLSFYYFGDVGGYDCYNPAYTWNKEYAAEILYLIAENQPFSLSKQKISTLLNIEYEKIDEVLNSLKLIDAIEVNNNSYRIKFPVFLDKDVIKMEKHISNIGELIGKKIISLDYLLYEKISQLKCSILHSRERILYHVICDQILDGTAFEFFKEKNTFCTSKSQPGDRNYIIVAYEHSEATEKYSKKLLCSSNNYKSSIFTFNSFGDANGTRKDIFRFFRLLQKSVQGATPLCELNTSYNNLLDTMGKEIAFKCGKLICKIIRGNYTTVDEEPLINFLKELEYVNINEADSTIFINIPVFYESENTTIIREISDLILTNIYPIVKEVFQNFQVNSSDLNWVKHNVDIKEIANELWHQIFGATNEYLVKEKFVSSPSCVDGDGRYFRSLTVNDL